MTDRQSVPQQTNNRCGCDCKNPTEFSVCDGRTMNTCCTHCSSGAPSAYAILWECFRVFGGAKHPPIEGVWRDCPFECIWVAKGASGYTVSPPSCPNYACSPCSIYNSQYYTYPFPDINLFTPFDPSLSPCDDEPCSPYSSHTEYAYEFGHGDQCGKIPRRTFPPVYTTDTYPDTFLSYPALPFKCCHPGPLVPEARQIVWDGEKTSRDGWYDRYNMGVDALEACFGGYVFNEFDCDVCQPSLTKWIEGCLTDVTILEVTGGGSATLTVKSFSLPSDPSPVPDAIYVSSDFDCTGRSNFDLTNRTDGMESLPNHVCVVAAVGNYRTPCDSPEAACNCWDNGWGNGILCFSSPCSTEGSVGLLRNDTLPSCVSPQSGPCGYFWGTIPMFNPNTGTGLGYLGFLVWCGGGTPYDMEVYCTTDNWATCDLVCSPSTVDTTSCPNGASFTWSCPDFGACCDIPCEGCNPTGLTLNYDISGPGNGSGTISGSMLMCIVKTLSNGDRISIEIDMSTCTVRIGCNGIDCTSFNCISSSVPVVNSCDPFDMEITITVGFLCSACARGVYTVNLYE